MTTTTQPSTHTAHDSEHLVEEGAAVHRLFEKGRRAPKRRYDVVVVGGGQSGLAVGYFLRRAGLSFVIIDGSERVGDAWRNRWDSLRLFTPAQYDGLPGMPFPAPYHTFPTKDEMADYLESYAKHFDLPVQSGERVERLEEVDGGYHVATTQGHYEADQVIVAMAKYQKPRVPDLAKDLRDDIVQLHSSAYKNPSQLQPGSVLIVGAGNSGADIALEVAKTHEISMSGRDVGHVPFRIEGFWSRFIVMRVLFRIVFHRILTIDTKIGRKVREKVLHPGGPLIRVKPDDLDAAGVKRLPKVIGTRDGLPLLEDGRTVDARNIIWSTGYHGAFSWIDLPIFDEHGDPKHHGGVAESAPGLYFVGLHYLYAMSSGMIQGMPRDAERIVRAAVARREVITTKTDGQVAEERSVEERLAVGMS